MRIQRMKGGWAILAVSVIAVGMVAAPAPQSSPRLVSVQHLPVQPDACEPTLMAALQQGIRDLPRTEEQERDARAARSAGARIPTRTIRDTAPTYSAVAYDANSDEVIVQDNNLWSYRVFDRLDNTLGPNETTTPKRIVQGDKTALQFNNGLYVDPQSGDITTLRSTTFTMKLPSPVHLLKRFCHSAEPPMEKKRLFALSREIRLKSKV